MSGPCRSSVVSFLRVFQVDFTVAGLLPVLTSKRLLFCLQCFQRLLLVFFRTAVLQRAR